MNYIESAAKKYAIELNRNGAIKDYEISWIESIYIHILGSKEAKIQKIKFLIEELSLHIEHPNKPGYKRSDIIQKIKYLKEQLEILTK